MQSEDIKFVALRTKTDRELFAIVVKDLEFALKIAGRNPIDAGRAHARALALLPGMHGLSSRQTAMLQAKIAMLGERLDRVTATKEDPWVATAFAARFQRCRYCAR